jgi:hypothetical protein
MENWMWSIFFIAKYQSLIQIDSLNLSGWFMDNILQASWSEARKFCCKLGMNLVTVYSVEKQDCLSDEFHNKGGSN